MEEFDYDMPPTLPTKSLLNFILVSTQDNNIMFHQMSAKVSFILENLENTRVNRFLNNGDDGAIL